MDWPKLSSMLGVFVLSLVASTFPTLSKRLSCLHVPHTLFFILKHFGTGVILSTAFVHLLQDAFKVLLGLPEGNPIRHWVGLIVLLSLLAIFLVEYLSMAYVERLEERDESDDEEEHYHQHQSSSSETLNLDADGCMCEPNTNDPLLPPLAEDIGLPTSERTSLLQESSKPVMAALPPRTVSDSRIYGTHLPVVPLRTNSRSIRTDCKNFKLIQRELHHHQEEVYANHGRCEVTPGTDEHQNGIGEDGDVDYSSASVNRKHAIVNTLVLQAGIMIHSLVIGLTLSIKSGPEFTSLVIAILFHQLFEGLSLGVRLAALTTSSPLRSSMTIPLILATIFATAVPIGCLIGRLTLGSSATSGSDSSTLPLTQGLTSAVSAGTLIYASGVELLAGDFLHSSLRHASAGKQALALISLTTGVAGMAALA